MSRMNNTSRSLKIISRQNGWDPDQIEGGGSILPVYHERKEPYDSDTWPVPAEMRDPQGGEQNHGGIEPRTIPEDHRQPPQRTRNADPYPDMPGAR